MGKLANVQCGPRGGSQRLGQVLGANGITLDIRSSAK